MSPTMDSTRVRIHVPGPERAGLGDGGRGPAPWSVPDRLNSAMWAKYKIGQALNIVDPETQAPAVKNPFLNAKPGVLPVDDMTRQAAREGNGLWRMQRCAAGPEQEAAANAGVERGGGGERMGGERDSGDSESFRPGHGA